MRFTIGLEKMLFHAPHGVKPEEHRLGNRIEVSLRVEADVNDLDDHPARTVDYERLYQVVAQTVRGPRRNLLETLAAQIGARVLAEFPQVAAVTVDISKINPPLQDLCDRAIVSLTLAR